MHVHEKTKLALSSKDKKIIVGIGIVAGLVLGLLSGLIWDLIEGVEWIPFHGLIESVMSVREAWAPIMRTGLLTLAGLVVAGIILHSSPQVTVSDESIEIRKGGNVRFIKRGQVAGIYREGSKVIIESDKGRQLFKDDIEGGESTVRAAFKKHNYPWESR